MLILLILNISTTFSGINTAMRSLSIMPATISNELRTGEVLGRVSADNFVILRYYNEKNDIMVRQQQVDIKITEFMHDMYGGQAVSVQCGICYLEDLAEDLQIEGILDPCKLCA